MKKIFKMYINVLFILSLSIALFSMMFNIYLVRKVSSYLTYSENLTKKYSKLKTDFDNTLKLLNFYLDVQKISALIKQFVNQDINYNITDIAFSIVEESVKNNLDPYLMLAIIKTESSFNHKSVSRKGAIGLMQLLPNTAYYISEKVEDLFIGSKKEIFDPVINIRLGVNYYRYLLNKFNGNEEIAIVAYNLGPRNIYKYLAKGRNIPKFYYYKVMQNYAELTAQIKS